jgi:hypothetical protein
MRHVFLALCSTSLHRLSTAAVVCAVLLLTTLAAVHVGGSMCGCEHRYATLMDFYNATNGPGWRLPPSVTTSTWGNTTSCAPDWLGVTCNGTDVTAIVLDACGLQGTLPPSLGNLSGLQTLLISSSPHLTGALPAAMASLTDLRTLNITRCQLSGTLPPEWSALTVLSLELASNRLSGPLPASWSAMSQLRVLLLSDNELTSSLPASWSMIHPVFGGLDPGFNQLSLDSNQLTGTLPDAWANMTVMVGLNLSNNRLSGSLPGSWAQLKIKTLLLGSNLFTGELPPSWGALPSAMGISLSSLDISSTCLRSSVPWPGKGLFALLTTSINNCNTRVLNTLRAPLVQGYVLQCPNSSVLGRWPSRCTTGTPTKSFSPTWNNSGGSTLFSVSRSFSATAEIPRIVVLAALAAAASAPLPATALLSVVSGVDPGSAQALLAVLESPCACGPGQVLDNPPPRAVSLALSPLVLFAGDDEIGAFEVAIGNVGIAMTVFLLHLTVTSAHHYCRRRRRGNDDDEDVTKQKGKEDNKDVTSIGYVHHIAVSASGSLLRFPSVSFKIALFLVPGVAWSVTMLVSTVSSAERGHSTTLSSGEVISASVIGIAFIFALGVILQRVVLRQWVMSADHGIAFVAFSSNVFSPPLPKVLASIACSRGRWNPAERRSAFGSPVATPFMPWCVRWAWAVGPATSVLGVALSTAHPTGADASSVCDGLQSLLIALYCCVALLMARTMPHKSTLRSLLSIFTSLHTAAVVLCGLLCRHGHTTQTTALIVATAGAYVSLSGSILVVLIDLFESRVLRTSGKRATDGPEQHEKIGMPFMPGAKTLRKKTKKSGATARRQDAGLRALVTLACAASHAAR